LTANRQSERVTAHICYTGGKETSHRGVGRRYLEKLSSRNCTHTTTS
jgi:hypothetical protein